MKFEIWVEQEFLRNIPKGQRIIEVLKIIHNYLNYRNIEQSEKQKSDIAEFVLTEILNLVYLKSYTIEWALKEYCDPSNNSISAAVVMGAIKKAYASAQHKEIMEKWEAYDAPNRLAPITDGKREEMNRTARKEFFDKCVEQVKNDKVNFDTLFWHNAIQYLVKDIGLKLTQEQLAPYQERAVQMVMDDLKKELSNVNLRRDERSRATILLADLMDMKIDDSDLKAKINLTRQKLVTMDYIYANYVDPSFNSFLAKINQGIEI